MTEAAAFFESLPKKRMGAGALLFDANGRVLVLKPGYKSHWEIPGGIVEADESPREGARREIREEIGLDIAEDRLQLVGLDYMAAGGGKTESLMFVFSAGVLSEEEIASIVFDRSEIDDGEFVFGEQAKERLGPVLGRRVQRCLSDNGFTYWEGRYA